MDTIGKRLKYLREIKGITQEAVADAITEKRATVANWETDRSEPSASTIVALADFFGVTTDFLLGRQTEAAEEEGFLYGLNPEAKKRLKGYANYERINQNLPKDEQADSSGLTNTDKKGEKIRLKRENPNKTDKKRKTVG